MKSFRAMFTGTAIMLFLLFSVGNVQSATTISLVQGWNLVSLPVQPTNTAIGSVLSGINGFYEVVWAYPNQAWKVYDPNDAGGEHPYHHAGGYGLLDKDDLRKDALRLGVCAAHLSSPLLRMEPRRLRRACVHSAHGGLDGPFRPGGKPEGRVGLSPSLSGLAVLRPGKPPSPLAQLCPNDGYWINVGSGATWTLGSVSGTAASGSPVQGATVTLVDANGLTATGTTGSDGSFTVSGRVRSRRLSCSKSQETAPSTA